MASSLLGAFSSADQSTKDVIADIESPLLLAFSALSLADELCGIQKLSSEHIVACLEAAGVAVTKKSISTALARAGTRVSRSIGLDGEVFYRLMTKGKREVAPLLGAGSLNVVRFAQGKPRTARMRLRDAMSGLSGLIRVCDPYYGIRTLDSLESVPAACSIRFLTAKTSEATGKVKNAFRDFVKERPTTEFRVAQKSAALHDRYVLGSDELLLVGHGLKDIGAKESFLVRIDKGLGKGLISETRDAFDENWKIATPLL